MRIGYVCKSEWALLQLTFFSNSQFWVTPIATTLESEVDTALAADFSHS